MKKKVSQLQEDAYHLSRTDRKAADAKLAEAEVLLKEIERLEANPE